MSWVEEDLVAPTVAPTQPSGITTGKGKPKGRPKGSKNKVSPPAIGVNLGASDTEDEDPVARETDNEAPVARRTRSQGKTQQASMITIETSDLNFGLVLQF